MLYLPEHLTLASLNMQQALLSMQNIIKMANYYMKQMILQDILAFLQL